MSFKTSKQKFFSKSKLLNSETGFSISNESLMSQNRSFFAGFRIEWFHIETTLVEITLITFPLLEFFFVEVALRLEIQIFFLEKLYVLMYDTSIYNVEEMYKNIWSKTKIYCWPSEARPTSVRQHNSTLLGDIWRHFFCPLSKIQSIE